jgi:hypothetical protein
MPDGDAEAFGALSKKVPKSMALASSSSVVTGSITSSEAHDPNSIAAMAAKNKTVFIMICF